MGWYPDGAIPPLQLQASTFPLYGPAGFALQNGTPTIIQWTPPNDGLMHRFMIGVSFLVTSAETGGSLQVTYNDPGGGGRIRQLFAAGQAAGYYNGQGTTPAMLTICEGGVPVIVEQSTALTAGAAVLWAEIWGS
jgi:hypothetical protein